MYQPTDNILNSSAFEKLYSIFEKYNCMDEQESYGIENIAYQQLQREFQGVLVNLSSDQSLDRFRVQYERIHQALRQSHEQERRLLSKCRQLSKDILAGAARVQNALRYSNDDSQTISYLKAELTKTYKFLEISRDHQQLSNQRIEKLKAEMKKLQIIMQQSESLTEGQVASVQEYRTTNEELAKEKEILQISVKTNQEELGQVKTKIQQIQQRKTLLQSQLQSLIESKNKEQEKVRQQQQDKKRKKEELEQIKTKFDSARAEQAEAKQKRKSLNVALKQKTAELHFYDVNKEKEKKFERKLLKQLDTAQKKNEQMDSILDSLRRLHEQKQSQLTHLTNQLEIEKAQAQQLAQIANSIAESIRKLKLEKQATQKLKQTIESGINQLQNQIGDDKKNSGKDRSFIEKLKRDRDMYQKEIERAEANNKKVEEEIIAKEKVVKEKENEIFGQKKEVERLNKTIMTLHKERDSYALQATTAEAKYYYSKDEVKLRDNFIAQFQKQNLQTEAKLKKQQTLYQAVRSDRNLVSKNLTDVQSQNEQYKRRYKMVNHQISQLKQQIDAKENQLLKQHNQHKKKDKKIEDESKRIEKFTKDIKQKEDRIRNYHSEVKKLYAIIKQSQTQKQKLQEEYELVVAERDILGTQLIRRSAEAELLYEKIKIHQSTLSKGQAQYRERLADISTKKEEIATLINQIKTYRQQTNSISDLKNQIHNLTRENTDAQLKVKALSQQLQNPMNVHRWRKLEATDSLTYQLMTKIQSIQKRLISKTEQVQNKQKELQSKQKELKDLEQILKRQPSVQQQKLIPTYEQTLLQKQQHMQAMLKQIEVLRSTLEEYKIELERLQRESDSFRKKYYYQKKREQQQKEQANKQLKDGTIQIHLPDKRFTGGGFNLAI